MRDWKIWRRVSNGAGIWIDLDSQETHLHQLAEPATRYLFESKFSSRHESWGSLTIAEKLEEVDKGKAFFTKIVAEDTNFFSWEYRNINMPTLIEERAKFLTDLAYAILLANLSLLGSAETMETQEIYEVKRTIEDVVSLTGETNFRIGSLISDAVSKLLMDVYVSKELMTVLDDLHLEKSSMPAKRVQKSECSSKLAEIYFKIWKYATDEIEKISKVKKVNPVYWQASLAPLKNIIPRDPTCASTSGKGIDILERKPSKQSAGYNSTTPSKDGFGQPQSKMVKPQQQWDSVSPTKFMPGYQPKSPVSPSAKIQTAKDEKAPGVGLPPLPLKKKKSKKPRQFDTGAS